MYYKLHEHCKIITGASRSAIYNLKDGKVYSINQSALNLITNLQDNELSPTNEENKLAKSFCDELTKKNLGSLYFIPTPTEQNTLLPPKPDLEFAWLEITSRCNNRCLHCYTNSTSEPTKTETLPLARWLTIISELRNSGCSALQLIGGEPLLYPNWRDLVLKAEEENFDLIEIFTNATCIDDEMINFFLEHHLNIATTIYASNATLHDTITQHKGSFEKTMCAIKKILAKKIPLRIASIIMKTNEDEAENIMELCKNLGVEATPPDVIRPTGRGENESLLPSHYQKPTIKPPFFTNELEFYHAKYFHPCLAGKIAITDTGEVLPCIFARNIHYGNITKTPLEEILHSKQLLTCWYTTKDTIKKCKDCEYRYACSDCRPLTQSNDKNKDWYAAPNNCSYNPYTGIWQ
ncbi:MAG: pqqE 2 [Firmicutes bacterium]|nr:pqqE 2 [Bacillota bacterium]